MADDAPRAEVTRLLARLGDDGTATEELLPIVYDELRSIAERCLRGERAGHTLQPTALVHEAFLKLVAQDDASFRNRPQFLGVCAQAMRRILVDAARARRARKRGGDWERVTLSAVPDRDGDAVDLLALDDALAELLRLSERQGRVVELRYFGGLTIPEAAATLGVSESTVEAEWRVARAWLGARLNAGD